MSEHPEELLAEYVEGTLGSDERALVESHLPTCDRCREEVALAAEARTALAGLTELDAPAGIPLSVRRARRGMSPRALRYAGTAAAAAIVVAGAIFGVSQLRDGAGDVGETAVPSAQSEAPAGPAEEETAFADAESAPAAGVGLDSAKVPALPTYEETSQDYETDDLAPLARRLRDEAHRALDAGAQRTAKTFFESFDPAAFTVPVRQAIRCVLAEVPPDQLVVPFRIEAAAFEGIPAYVAAFLQGPTPEDAYDRVVIWVVDRETCSLQSLASQLL